MAKTDQTVVFLVCILTLCIPAFGYRRIITSRKPKGKLSGLPKDQWVEQRLDHFNPADVRTWKQKYNVNDTFFEPGGPVFLMIGGEGPADPTWLLEGQWINYAQKHHALCVQLEHRYYGKSHPTKDLSVENLQYLSSEQALADLAYFRNYIVEKMNLKNNKWIAFGGSYPGGLAAWFRYKYPHLVDGAVSASAPVFAKINFKEYLEVVTDSLSSNSKECVTSISSAVQSIENMLTTSSGKQNLKVKFKLCDVIDEKNNNDLANLFETLAGNFEDVVQYNKDNRAFEGAKGTNITIDTLCGIMTDKRIGEPIDRYAAVNKLILETYDEKCVDFKYDKMIQDMKSIDWNSSTAEGGRQWFYQTCTEFGYYQTSDLKLQPFGHRFPLSFFVQQCKDVFGPKFTKDFLEYGINRTNTNYGGYGLKVKKVVFVNGSIDPWHALGILKDLNEESPAIFIEGTAHCANMYPDSADDPQQLKDARMKIDQLIGEWIQS